MTTRVLERGRVAWASGEWFKPGVVSDASDDEILYTPEDPRAGVAWDDPEDGLTYRVVSRGVLTPDGGWGDAGFWLKHLGTRWHIFRELVLRGCFDAAIEEGVCARRYRLLDDGRARAHLEAIRVRNIRRREL